MLGLNFVVHVNLVNRPSFGMVSYNTTRKPRLKYHPLSVLRCWLWHLQWQPVFSFRVWVYHRSANTSNSGVQTLILSGFTCVSYLHGKVACLSKVTV